MQIPLEQYSPDIKYIYTKDRPEMGKVTQKNFVSQNGFQFIQLSGYFLEYELSRHVVYQKGTTNISGAPAWVEQNGNAEDVAYAFFNAFKAITVNGVTASLDMAVGTSQNRGKKAVHTRNGEYLNWKIYDILKPSGMSYRVLYDFENNMKKFEVWTGFDRSQDNGVNNPIIFSTKYGNIKNPNIVIEEAGYKNACIVTNEQVQNETSEYTVRAVLNKAADDTEYAFWYEQSGLNKNDYTDEDFPEALENEGMNALNEHIKTINVEFDAMEGSYEYGIDFDLGDLCSIEIPEMNISAEARLIGCYEVMKKGGFSMTMEFGTPIIIKR